MESRLDLGDDDDVEESEVGDEDESDPEDGFDDPKVDDVDDEPDLSVVLKWTTIPLRVPYLVLTERGERVSLSS